MRSFQRSLAAILNAIRPHTPPPLRARTPQRIHAPAQTWVAAILNAMRPYTSPPPPRARTPQRIHAPAQTWVAAILKKRACKSARAEKIDKSKPPTLKHVHIGTHQPWYPGTVTAPVIMSIFSLIHEYCYYSVQKIAKEYNFVSNLNRIVDIISLFLLFFFFSVAKRFCDYILHLKISHLLSL